MSTRDDVILHFLKSDRPDGEFIGRLFAAIAEPFETWLDAEIDRGSSSVEVLNAVAIVGGHYLPLMVIQAARGPMKTTEDVEALSALLKAIGNSVTGFADTIKQSKEEIIARVHDQTKV